MTERHKQIGFSQRIQLEWLEKTANLVLAGNDRPQIESALQALLNDKLSVGGQAKRGTREKAITILLKVWVAVPKGLESLRNAGLELLRHSPKAHRLAVHWGMSMATYPFLLAIATNTGRLLNLQSSAAAVQVQRRVREQYGERETVSRAARRVLRMFVDWGVLEESSTRGVYIAGPVRVIEDPALIAWLVEAVLRAGDNGNCALKAVLESPSLFPFRLAAISTNLLSRNQNLDIVRHGLDDDMVVLR